MPIRRLFQFSDRAFTLIELLVVILIIGILAAIALPTFLNQQNKAKDSEAVQALNTAYKVARSEATSNDGEFPSVSRLTAAIGSSEPQMSVNSIASTGAVSSTGVLYVVDASAGGNLTLAYKSQSGNVCVLQQTGRAAPQITGCSGSVGGSSSTPPPASYEDQVAALGGIGYWPFATNANNAISGSGAAGNGTATPVLVGGNTQYGIVSTPGGPGTSLYLSGSKMSIPWTMPTGSFTIETWVAKTSSSASNYRHFVESYNAQNGFALYNLLAPGNRARFDVRAQGTTASVTGTSALNAGVWYHLVGVFERGAGSDPNTVRLYVNGTLQGSASLNPDPGAFSGPIYLNSYGDGGNEADYMYYYRLAVYDEALSASTISSHYTSGSVGS